MLAYAVSEISQFADPCRPVQSCLHHAKGGTLSDEAQASGSVKAEEACVYHRKGAATAPFRRTQAQASKKQELRCLPCPQPKANRECSPTIDDQAKGECRHEDRQSVRQ